LEGEEPPDIRAPTFDFGTARIDPGSSSPPQEHTKDDSARVSTPRSPTQFQYGRWANSDKRRPEKHLFKKRIESLQLQDRQQRKWTEWAGTTLQI